MKKSMTIDVKNPTDILSKDLDSTATSSSSAKSISIGSLGLSKKSLVSVKTKPVAPVKTEIKGKGTSVSEDTNGNTKNNTALNLLGCYGSDSESD